MSYARPAQSKAQNEANAKALRAMVKQPGNKVCADCKRNDPRWASWNLGCFLCIRCSGIHRSMGTHISKVKSIDLDIWTPEQMDSVTKWGNHRSNLYWEAHLKPGHEPPEHKVESFIRSKYESRRWAKEGPPPSDPSTLEPGGGGGSSAPTPTPAPQTTQNNTTSTSRSQPTSSTNRTNATASAPPRKSAIDLLGGDDDDGFQSKPQQQSQPQSVNSNAPPKATPTTTAAAAAAPKPSGGGGGLFDLDWHEPQASNPTSPTVGSGAKGKNDILSLFSNNTAPPQQQFQQQVRSPGGMRGLDSFGGMNLGSNSASSPTNSFNNFGGGASNQSQSQNQNQNPLVGGGMGMSDPWASNSNSSANQIGNKSSGSGGVGAGSGIFDSHDIWGTPAGSNSSNSNGAASAGNGLGGAKKDNAFDDLWSDFK